MTDHFRIALAQLNPTVGALEANSRIVKSTVRSLQNTGVDYVVFPEMFLSGYPIQDLVTKDAFVKDCMKHLSELAEWNQSSVAIGVGCPWCIDRQIFNSYQILQDGKIVTQIQKHHLPFGEVFDEVRQFVPGALCGPYSINGVKIGTPICEDAWYDDVCETLVESGAEILIVPNGSPYGRNKHDRRLQVMLSRVVETGLPLAYLNMVGGQDDQVLDGGSFVLNKGGAMASQMPHFEDVIGIVDFELQSEGWHARSPHLATIPCEYEMDYRAITVGVRDYIEKSGFSTALVGLSGGIDSALVAAIAVDVIGPKNTYCVMLPSQFTSIPSFRDARELVANLGCHLSEIDIEPIFAAALDSLAVHFADKSPDLTEENLQSRIRGLLLMALSNKFGHLLMTTGNKSEAAVGYATIYGDMAGGYNPIKDLYKTRVLDTARWRNAHHRAWMKGPEGPVIPQNIITKPPTAELRNDQKDSDSLPPYEILDQILEMLIDQDRSVAEIVASGFEQELVSRVEQLVYQSEYKRYQSAPGVRLTGRALWLDRRYPIVNHWRDPM